jgi:L-asparaginase
VHKPGEEIKVNVFTLGGTIDKMYSPASAGLVIGSPFVTEVSDFLRLEVSWHIEEISKKDSLDLDDADREILSSSVDRSLVAHIIVTHGTDTLIETAKYLDRRLDLVKEGKTVVFTGAFLPGRFVSHEAVFNVGFALAVALTFAPGVYIAMGGLVYTPRAVSKSTDGQRFIALPEDLK